MRPKGSYMICGVAGHRNHDSVPGRSGHWAAVRAGPDPPVAQPRGGDVKAIPRCGGGFGAVLCLPLADLQTRGHRPLKKGFRKRGPHRLWHRQRLETDFSASADIPSPCQPRSKSMSLDLGSWSSSRSRIMIRDGSIAAWPTKTASCRRSPDSIFVNPAIESGSIPRTCALSASLVMRRTIQELH